MKNKYLYIPLEIFNRELNGMLLLSLVAAKNGWQVVLGGKKTIFPVLNELPNGVVLLKSIVPGEIDTQKKIASYGHKITSIDAEGLIPSNGSSGVKLRYSQQTIESSEMLFFWGEDQFNQVKAVFPSIEKNGLITGSPIFDYWRYLKKSYTIIDDTKKKTILIATSFPYANHIMDSQQPYDAVRHASGENATQSHFDELFLDGELQEVIYPQFKNLVSYLSQNLQDYNILLRPHPTEDIKPWKKIADENNNVELQFGGQISDIILNSDIFIHFNSTASIEAYYYEKKVITFIPSVKNELFDRISKYTLAASNVCSTFKDVVDSINNSEDCNDGISSLKPNIELHKIISNSDSSNIVASCEAIVNSLNNIDIQSDVTRLSKLKLLFSFNTIKTRLRNRLVWFVAWLDYLFNIFSGKYASTRNYYKYGKTKQGALPKQELQNKIHNISTILDMSANDFRLEKIKSGMFLIKKNANKY